MLHPIIIDLDAQDSNDHGDQEGGYDYFTLLSRTLGDACAKGIATTPTRYDAPYANGNGCSMPWIAMS
jgi:hypothetical protein